MLYVHEMHSFPDISNNNDNSYNQGLSQELETGCPKLPILKFWGIHIFKGGPLYPQISNINMY